MKSIQRNSTEVQKSGAPATPRLSFDPFPGESQDEYEMFLRFLESDPSYSPMRWIASRELGPKWNTIAVRNGWMTRRLSYWQYQTSVQRMRATNMLAEYLGDIAERRAGMAERIRALNDEMSRGDPDKRTAKEHAAAIKQFNDDVRLVAGIMSALKNESGQITIVNNRANVSPQANIGLGNVREEWDQAASKTIIDLSPNDID